MIDDRADVSMPSNFLLAIGLEDALFEYLRKLACWFRGMINEISKPRYIFSEINMQYV